jgi:hypothetical protein
MCSYEDMARGEGSGEDYHVIVAGMLTIHRLCSTLAQAIGQIWADLFPCTSIELDIVINHSKIMLGKSC